MSLFYTSRIPLVFLFVSILLSSPFSAVEAKQNTSSDNFAQKPSVAEFFVTQKVLPQSLFSALISSSSKSAAEVSFLKNSAKKIHTKNGDTGLFTIKFSVTAKSDTLYINSQLMDPVLNNPVSADHEYSLESSAVKMGTYYVVNNSSSETFTLTDKVTPHVSDKYNMFMSGLIYVKGTINGPRALAYVKPESLSKSTTKSLNLKKVNDNKTPKKEVEKFKSMTNRTNPLVILTTNKGVIELELFKDTMPITTSNFITLAKNEFYNGTKFHRVIDGFMIQGGDPLTKAADTIQYGTGGPGYSIQDEFVEGKYLTNVRGTLAMANSGPDTGGSQFFINLVDNVALDFNVPDPNNSANPVFGRVVKGMDVVDAIGNSKTGARDLPIDPIVITELNIVE